MIKTRSAPRLSDDLAMPSAHKLAGPAIHANGGCAWSCLHWHGAVAIHRQPRDLINMRLGGAVTWPCHLCRRATY